MYYISFILPCNFLLTYILRQKKRIFNIYQEQFYCLLILFTLSFKIKKIGVGFPDWLINNNTHNHKRNGSLFQLSAHSCSIKLLLRNINYYAAL